MRNYDEELDKMFQEELNSLQPRNRKPAPTPPARGKFTSGGMDHRTKKMIILSVAAVILLAWAMWMTNWSGSYGTESAAQPIQMNSFQGLFMDMDGNGQLDTLLIDINNDGVIDARMVGEFTEITQFNDQNPTLPGQ